MSRFLTIVLFLLSGLLVHAVGSDYLGEFLKQVVQSANDTKTSHDTKNPPSANSTQAVSARSDIAPITKNSTHGSHEHLNGRVGATSGEVVSELADAVDFKKYLFDIDWKSWIFKLLHIIFIISLSIFIWRVSNNAAQRYIKNARLFKKMATNSSLSTQALIKTIAPIIKSIFHWILIILTALMVLRALDVDTAPILVSFSIIGVAFAIGSQALMKDLVNGILMLFEGNVAVGDVVTIGDKTGTVESLSLRALLLRHFTGELQTIPLSEVTALINCSRDYSVAVIQFVVDPKALISDIQKALTETYKSMKHDSKYGGYISGDLGDLGVKVMSEIGVTMSATIPIKPDPRKSFLAEFNRRFYEQLQVHGVPLAYARV